MPNENWSIWRTFETELETAIGSIKHSADAICAMQDLFEQLEGQLHAARETNNVLNEVINDLIDISSADNAVQPVITALDKACKQLREDLAT